MQMSGDPHGPRPTLPGAQLTKQSAGLSAWQHQKGAEERPFLNTLSIGILIFGQKVSLELADAVSSGLNRMRGVTG